MSRGNLLQCERGAGFSLSSPSPLIMFGDERIIPPPTTTLPSHDTPLRCAARARLNADVNHAASTECRSSSTGWQMPVTTSVLLIGSSHAVGTAVQEALAEIGPGAFALEGAARLSEAIERLSKAGIDAILSHLTLPDCQ